MSDDAHGDDHFTTKRLNKANPDDFLIVGIGASAGGVGALKEFFSHTPVDSGMAYVVILHLSPDYDSQLAQVLQTATHIPVSQVHVQAKVEPNQIYVVSPNHSLKMQDGHIVVSEITRVEERRAPIDIFFRTLAESHHARAVCVILSGTGADGSMGMKRVKENGGICIVQDPQEAQHADMPRNAIATRLVDHVLPVAQIPSQIASYDKHRGTLELPRSVILRDEPEDQALREIFTQLRLRTGHDFSSYKRSTVLRRIERRISVHALPDLASYARMIREKADEARALLKDLLISVTNFFRDPAAFTVLETQVIPKLFEGKGPGDQLRVWVAGCATGEEAYSIAMLLSEYAPDPVSGPTLQVFATDIDEWALSKARSGLYSLIDAADVSPERLRRFFSKESDGYRVRREIREIVLFASHNVIKDPPFSHLDLITCRNLLIYLNRTAQERVMDVIHFALNPGGFLFLGNSESIEGSGHLFVPIDKENHIFQSRPVEARRTLPVPPPAKQVSFGGLHPVELESGQSRRLRDRLSYQELHQRLLEQFAPPSVIVNEEYDILHLSERAGRYMQVVGGDPTSNLLKLVRPELRLDLRTALYQALQNRANVEARGLSVSIDGKPEVVHLHVRPVLSEHDAARGYFLILFEQAGDAAIPQAIAVETVTHSAEPIARHLEEELIRVKAQLRLTSDQHELNQEELKASNEELQAINEELRSSTEELETSKEELQSVNEELTTVNQELKIKIEELSQSNDDLKNLISSTEIGTIFLDRGMRIKLFTPRARELFNLIPADTGRPLSDITSSLLAPVPLTDLERVIERLQPIEREVLTSDQHWYLMRILPYRTAEDHINGVVLTFLEITHRKQAEEQLRASEEQFRQAIEAAPIPVILYAEDGKVLQLNQSWTAQTGFSISDLPTLDSWLKTVLEPGAEQLRKEMLALLQKGNGSLQIELQVLLQSRKVQTWTFSASSPGTLPDGRRFFVGMAVDITERQGIENALRESEERNRLIVENARDFAIFITDPQGRVSSWNPGAERIFQYAGEEILGQDCDLLFTPEDRAVGESTKELATAAREGRASDDRWQLRKDGSRFWASGVTAAMHNAQGQLIGFAKILRDLTHQKLAEDALEAARDQLELRVQERTRELRAANQSLQQEIGERQTLEQARYELLQRLASAQEEERRHIARELHDEMGQLIAALLMELQAVEANVPRTVEVQKRLVQARHIADQISRELHDVALELRPTALDDLGLHAALPQYIETWSARSGVRAEFHSGGIQEHRLPSAVETALYRVIQEALTNVVKHAAATRVSIVVERRDNQVVAIIEDDGKSFDVEQTLATAAPQRHLGLIGMRERLTALHGTLEIESAPGQGTTIFASVPLTGLQ